jgi:hypothetical protein|tara:strand:+ start:3235 stop:3624 length:390 start_codon:yes stop_codon:yes gene_type:complete
MKILIPVSVGELVDKITILAIKSNLITDTEKLKNIDKELSALRKVLDSLNLDSDNFSNMYTDLLDTNMKLWQIEDEIRILEKKNDFGENFISLARDVYITNDTRFDIKNKINDFFGSSYKEEKSYEEYK